MILLHALIICFNEQQLITKLPPFSDYFRIALIVWKTLVSGEQSLNRETSTPVAQIQTWTLTTGYFKHILMYFHGYIIQPVSDNMSCFYWSRLLWEVWIPVMRSCVSSWQPCIVGPMVDCVDVWAPLVPLWILDHLLEQLILPRLQREVGTLWDTLTWM